MSPPKFLWSLLLIGLVALAVVPAGIGARPDRFHDRVVATFEEEICGIPVTVRSVNVFTAQAFFDRQGNFRRFVSTGSLRETFTDAEGDSVSLQASGRYQDVEPLVNEEAGTITFLFSYRGLPEKLQTTRGPVLLRDAGFISFADTFDLETGEFISSEILVNNGPHPEAESDFELFCEVFTEALA